MKLPALAVLAALVVVQSGEMAGVDVLHGGVGEAACVVCGLWEMQGLGVGFQGMRMWDGDGGGGFVMRDEGRGRGRG